MQGDRALISRPVLTEPGSDRSSSSKTRFPFHANSEEIKAPFMSLLATPVRGERPGAERWFEGDGLAPSQSLKHIGFPHQFTG